MKSNSEKPPKFSILEAVKAHFESHEKEMFEMGEIIEHFTKILRKEGFFPTSARSAVDTLFRRGLIGRIPVNGGVYEYGWKAWMDKEGIRHESYKKKS